MRHRTEQGDYLDGGEHGEILLPSRYVPEYFEEGDEIDVFVYRDSEDRLVAVTDIPICEVEQFGCFEVISINQSVGAFLNWGLAKDLLLPFREQAIRVRIGDHVVARVLVDRKTDRIIASTKTKRYLKTAAADERRGRKVSMLILDRTPLGYNAIIDHRFKGLLYHSEVKDLKNPIEIGQTLEGYIAQLRPEGRIDLSLHPSGYKRVRTLTDQILDALEQNDGKLDLNDKSSPEQIRQIFGTSKKAFKQALGSLYKKRKIQFQDNGIRILEESEKIPIKIKPARKPHYPRKTNRSR